MTTKRLIRCCILFSHRLIPLVLILLTINTPTVFSQNQVDPVNGVDFPFAKINTTQLSSNSFEFTDNSSSANGLIVRRDWYHNFIKVSSGEVFNITFEDGYHVIELRVTDELGKKRTAYVSKFINDGPPIPVPDKEYLTRTVSGNSDTVITEQLLIKDSYYHVQVQLEGGWGNADLKVFADEQTESLCNAHSKYDEYCIIENPKQYSKLTIKVIGVSDFGNARLKIVDQSTMPPPPPFTPINNTDFISFDVIEETPEGKLIQFTNTYIPSPNSEAKSYWNFGDYTVSDEQITTHFFRHNEPITVNLYHIEFYSFIYHDSLTIDTPDYPLLKNNEPIDNLSGNKGSTQYFKVEIPYNTSQLKVRIFGNQGDADLYVLQGEIPTENNYDCRPYRWGSYESCYFYRPNQGTYYVMLKAYSDFKNVSLVARY